MLNELQETVNYINVKTRNFTPECGVVLGTGLGGLVNEIEVEYQLLYANIPGFPISTLEFHSGRLIFGTLAGKKVVAMQGRLHYYEGYSMQQVTFPIRVLKYLGIKTLFISNAAGSLNPAMKKGDLMVLNDHINLLPDNPLRGINEPELGPRFPDMSKPYKGTLIKKALAIAAAEKITCHQGVYVAVQGPSLETRAEYKYMRIIGGDAVGMSTVPEVIVANHMKLPVFAVSVLTDEGFNENPEKIDIKDIVKTAETAQPMLTRLLTQLINSI